MEQDLKGAVIQSLQTTDDTARTKRPYNKISSELRAQILHALTVEKIPLSEVAQKFQTKPCTCKAILLTYELEGRSEKKTSRRERVEIESKIRIVILDPSGNKHQTYENAKYSKLYTEDKELSVNEEFNIQKKVVQEVTQQLGEFQTSCYHLQSQQSQTQNDERAPDNILRGLNMGLHLVTSKIREGQIAFNKKTTKENIKQNNQININNNNININNNCNNNNSNQTNNYNKIENENEVPFQINYTQIQSFLKNVETKSESNPYILDQLNQLTNQTIFQMKLIQKIQQRDSQIKQFQQQVGMIIRKCFECQS
ncbi:unnamed protein product (macronuclear) [Paramecium tetraurelia]|uniref:HTH psq-type domain-containing protein n=1 Tax=Paramecium tetraurelia TaxID=5888 RepID=A0C9W1_PARTE|nr:uncharacterized protein GSPATT00006885001 [Paramecium tetraurelia]CAK67578.1 unnamed protein product [Paramecium tetraurelia]|eukprot:XP_001434975.1 hypothetical protein (macronuclear) [Paramecium tetraurelia strain d4-2]